MEPRERIIKGAETLFRRYSIRSVTMDDISRELGMSKKTLYQHFENKAEIVSGVLEAHFGNERSMCCQISEEAADAVQEMVQVIRWAATVFSQTPTHVFYELQKYYPEAWKLVTDFQQGFIADQIRQNLERGIAAGLYRAEIDPEILARTRIAEVNAIFNPHLFPPDRFDLGKVMVQQAENYLHGLLTPEGKLLIQHYINS